jgi:hypothetical protein
MALDRVAAYRWTLMHTEALTGACAELSLRKASVIGSRGARYEIKL